MSPERARKNEREQGPGRAEAGYNSATGRHGHQQLHCEPSMSEIPRSDAIVQQGIADGLHIGAQLYASVKGRPVVERAWGESRPGVAMTTGTIMLWLSSVKPVGAVAILQLVERGRLTLDDPVARYIGEFAAGDRYAVTVRHLLTHTAGLRNVELDPLVMSWDEIIDRICAAPLETDWIPGERAGYSPQTSWYLLAELVRRLDGRDYSTYVRDEIFLPFVMGYSWNGMSAEQYRDYVQRIATMPDMTKRDRPPQRYTIEQGATVCVPGGNGMGPARELGAFYMMLLGGGQRFARILTPESLAMMTSRQRIGMVDETFRHVMDWGLGLIINSKRYGENVPYGFGDHTSERTFGHGGARSSVGMADPEHGLAVAMIFNGTPGERGHNTRIRAFLTALYEDLGLAAS